MVVRDYKEHGGRKGGKDDIASSSPSLSSWQSQPQITQTSDRSSAENASRRTWASSSNLFKDDNNTVPVQQIERRQPQNDTTNFYTNRPASWTSTPDLGMNNDESQSNIPTFSITLPRKRPTTIAVDTGQRTGKNLSSFISSTQTQQKNTT